MRAFNCFTEIFETVIKMQLVLFLERQRVFQYAASANQNIRGKEINLDNKFLATDILMDLSKAFDCFSNDLLIAKVLLYCFKGTALNTSNHF